MYSETMNEFFATNRLSAYIDGELPEAEMAEVEKAIRENPSIRAEYSRMMNAVELLRSQGPTKAPEGFSQRLEARLSVEKAPKPRLSWLPAPLRRVPMEALGLAMAALLVVFLIQRDPTPDVEQEKDAEILAKEEQNLPAKEEAPEAKSEELSSVATELSEEDSFEARKEDVQRKKEKSPPRISEKGSGRKGASPNSARPIAVPDVAEGQINEEKADHI